MSTMEGLTARGARKTVSTDDYAEPVATLSVSGRIRQATRRASGLRIPHPPLQPCPTCWMDAGGSLKSQSQHEILLGLAQLSPPGDVRAPSTMMQGDASSTGCV
jgi:hypothetical protein